MNLRFCDIEPAGYIDELGSSDSPIASWYRRVREVPIRELDIGDVCRAVRQELFLAQTLPVAFEFLREDVQAGDTYDGQLLAALAQVPVEKYKVLGNMHEIRDYLAEQSKTSDNFDPELKEDLHKLMSILKQSS